ncbi:MAG TPA: pantoate--beta-alanine ligase [Candidatus Copromorpha excrementigallinarum]|uniref:Pantothenate synthetase n=1 Tax=Candidatus Allocopromorpha excrementigallinarum TaxID=2840742 RepID=A0A9D1L6L6_9FIRM|nr:pantoate--beta-alanine ligase [Candidatus Copromorpha excrementigallinarum]
MITATTKDEVRKQVKRWKEAGLTVGLVPTMGALHQGHVSLVEASVSQCDRTVASVFVNPTQFSAGEDLEAYPRDFERDREILEKAGCSMVFHPSVEEMYPAGSATYVDMDSEMTRQLCGRSRPAHFRGVCTVVSKLFNIVTPHKAFFGEKDAQQLAVIRQMERDMAFGITIVGCPTVREEDGLARSSRNAYLKEEERKAASVLYKAVVEGRRLIRRGEGNGRRIEKAMRELIEKEPLARIDYVEAVDGATLQPKETVEDGDLIALAVYIGKTRLIDNFTVRNGERESIKK